MTRTKADTESTVSSKASQGGSLLSSLSNAFPFGHSGNDSIKSKLGIGSRNSEPGSPTTPQTNSRATTPMSNEFSAHHSATFTRHSEAAETLGHGSYSLDDISSDDDLNDNDKSRDNSIYDGKKGLLRRDYSSASSKMAPGAKSASPEPGSHLKNNLIKRDASFDFSRDEYDNSDSDDTGTPQKYADDNEGKRHHRQGSCRDGAERSGSTIRFASAKRNNMFHRMFPAVPKTDQLVGDWGCALARDILVHGRLYCTPRSLRFYSNILGWTTHVVIPFKEVLDIQTKTTAGLFPNGISIQTLHSRYNLASFSKRDNVMELLREVWHQNDDLASDEEVEGDYSDGESHSDGETDVESWSTSDSFSDTEDEGRLQTSRSDPGPWPTKDNDAGEKLKKASASSAVKTKGQAKWPVANLGPETHAKTEMPKLDPKEKVTGNCEINAPLGVVANLIFGDDTSWYKDMMINHEHVRELETVPQFTESGGKEMRKLEYIRPLSGPVGPKQTRCLCTETKECWNMEDRVELIQTCRTPDVPSGDNFCVYTRTLMVWADDNHTAIQTSTWVEWTGRSWIKGPIERGSIDGSSQHTKLLQELLEKSLGNGPRRGGSRKKHKQVKETKETKKPEAAGTTLMCRTFEGLKEVIPQNVLQLIVAVLLIVVLVFIYLSMRTRKENSYQHELELWRWLDERTLPQSQFDFDDLTRRELEEVINLGENNLLKMKEYLRHLDSN